MVTDPFDVAWDVAKGKFRGYSRNNISDRDSKASKARAWSQSRKNKRRRTRRRYARNKTRGNVRPKMRRQLGAGGAREQVSKEWGEMLRPEGYEPILMKQFRWEGKTGSESDIMDKVNQVMSDYESWKNKEGPKPQLRVPPANVRSAARKKPMRDMMIEGGGGTQALLNAIPGLTDRSKGGIPQTVNWWGGKQQLGNYFREMFRPYRDTHRPVEMFGGAHQMLNALNNPSGLYTEINPDLVNNLEMTQRGLFVPDYGPNTKEVLQEITDRANKIRYKRDVLELPLSLDEKMELAQLFTSANSRAFQGSMNYKLDDDWNKGMGRMKPGIRRVQGGRGEPSISMDLRALAPLTRDWTVLNKPFQEVAPTLGEKDFTYFDPPYPHRTFNYADNIEQSSRDADSQLQRETIEAAINSAGPVIYSNYLTNPNTGEVLHELTDPLIDDDFTIDAWPRNIKTSKPGGKNVLEMIATRDIDWPGMGRKGFKIPESTLREFGF